MLLGDRFHSIRTLFAMDIHKARDHVSHSVILSVLQHLNLPPGVCHFVCSFLNSRSFAIRIGKKRVGYIISEQGAPQAYVLSPVPFNVALIPLAWQLAAHPL